MDKLKFIPPRAPTPEEQESLDFFDKNLDNLLYPKNWKWKLKNERQHKVPKVFLDGFTNGDDRLYLYDAIEGKLKAEDKILTSEMLKEKDFYVFKEEDGTQNYIIEKYLFAYLLEGNIGQVISKIQKKETLWERDWQILTGFIAFQFVRTDDYIQNNKDRIEFFMKHYAQNQFNSFDDYKKEFPNSNIKEYDFFKSNNWTVEMDRQSAMLESIRAWNKYWSDFLNADYEVLETNKSNFFIISDNPFFIIPPSGWNRSIGVWYFSPDAENIIPINSTQCLRINIVNQKNYWLSIKYKTINHKETNRINSFTCKNASRFIMSNNKKYLEDLVKSIDFNKCRIEKKSNRFEYDDAKKLIITRNMYPS